MQRAVVIGSSPAGLRAAAVLASHGVETRYLGTAAEPSGVGVEPPFGLGAVGVRDGEEAGLARVWGAVGDHVEARRGLWLGGRLYELPLGRSALVDVLRTSAPRAIAGVVAARTRHRLGNVVDLGREERSYQAWLVNRVGAGVHERLFAPYARKRWASEPDELTPWLAWWTHTRPAPRRWVAPAAGQAAAVAHQHELILGAGGEVLEGVVIEAIEVDGRVVAVLTDSGREHVDELLAVDLSPRALAERLPDEVVDEAWRFDAARLATAHRVQVTVPARADSLPWDLHVVDAERPFWRLTRPGLLPGEQRWDGMVTAHLTLNEDDPLWRVDDDALGATVRDALADIATVEGDPIVQRLPDAVPLHRITTAPALARRLDALDGLGVLAVGPRAAFRPMDAAEEAALVDAIVGREPRAGPPGARRVIDQHDVHRERFERPVRLPGRASPRPYASD